MGCSGFFGYKSHFTALYLFVLVLTFSSQGKPFRICIGEVKLDVSDSKFTVHIIPGTLVCMQILIH